VISPHLPVLEVVLPLISAPICLVLRSGTIAWAIAAAMTWGAFAGALMLLAAVIDTGTISYALGGWPAPWGIEYRIDMLSAFVLVTISAIGAIVIVFARASVAREIPADRIYLFYVMYLLSFTGLLGITVTGDAFNLFVFLEIASLSAYVLISLGHDRRALTASFRYLIMGTVGATFYIIGVGMMYMMTGTLNMADLAARLPGLLHLRTMEMALAFLTVGLSLKLALFPLHFWLPNAYTYAPSAVSAFLAATSTKVAVYALIRILYTVFGGPAVFAVMPINEMLLGFGLLSMIAASLVAIFQDNVKRLLAYSSISQLGYMVTGLSLGNVEGLAGSIVHIFNHAMMKSLLFMALGCVFYRIGSVRFADIRGFGRRMPLTAASLLIGGFSLIGAPLSIGFITKWYLLQAAFAKGWVPVAGIVILSGLLALIYVWRMVEAAYFRAPTPAMDGVRDPPALMLAPMLVLAAVNLVFGIDGTITGNLALAAARSLIGSGP
jgi:multicomponent Na+:H+ antiporter subunit D